MRRLLLLTAAAAAIGAAPASAAPGELDGSFASGGRLIAGSPPLADTPANAVAVQRDGKIVTAGGDVPALTKGFTVARFNPDGTPDRSFDGDGVRVVRFGGRRDASTAYAVAIDRRGRIVVGGTWSRQVEAGNGEQDAQFSHSWALARLRRDGRSDRSFGGDGKVVTRFPAPGGITAVTLASRGRIVAVGNGFGVARYRPNGRLDRSFSRDGRRTVRFLRGGQQRASAVALTSGGSMIVAGRASGRGLAALDHYALARLKPGGALDRRFGRAGRVIGRGADKQVRDMKVDRRGRIVVGGERSIPDGDGSEIEVARYTRRGRLDRSFGRRGVASTRIGSIAYTGGIALAGDGKIVVGATVFVNVQEVGQITGRAGFGVARFTARGALDRSFSGDGVQTTSMGDRGDSGNDVAIQRDGKIVVAGSGGRADATAVARYLAK